MFDNESIKTYAIQAVTGFVSKGVPLSLGISKIASDNSLQPEQIKRVVEASNTITHLKLLGSEQKRDFEFPVAKYEEVLGHMVMPENNGNVGSAFVDQTKNIQEQSEAYPSPGENIKYASIHQAELETYIAKSIIATKANMEKLACDLQMKMLEIESSIYRLQKQEHYMEKFAEVSQEFEFGLIFGLEKSAGLNSKLVFTDIELVEARKLVGLIKEAEEIIQDKVAGGKALNRAAELAGKGLGKPIGAVAQPVARGIRNTAENLGNLASSKVKNVTPSPAATHMVQTAKSLGGKVANVGLAAAFTSHTNGNVWNQLQQG